MLPLVAGCSGSRPEECERSPRRAPDQAFEADAERGEAWVLPFGDVPPRVDEEMKLVWRVTGEGDLRVWAIGPDGAKSEPTQGPTRHDGSNFDRPGDEWGTFFHFSKTGCWKLHAERGDTEATVTLRVVD